MLFLIGPVNTRILVPDDKLNLEVLVKEFIEKEALCKHMNLTEDDKTIYAHAYVDVS